jgi:BlaI family transcriptional regulator, penicillinase repressor
MEKRMKRLPKISDAEWQVMRILWQSGPKTTNEIVEELTSCSAWKQETIRTLINRLVQKKALSFKKKGRQYLYTPRVAEADCVRAKTKTFLDHFLGGSVEPMLAALVENEELTPAQIKRLKQILDGKDLSKKKS